jgi:hypothetical protein
MMEEQDQEDQNQNEDQNEDTSTASEQPFNGVSQEDFNRYVAMQERAFAASEARAMQAQAELDRVRNTPAPARDQPRNYDELNRRVSEDGQLAQVVEETVDALLAKRMQPMTDKFARDARRDRLSSLVTQVINSHPQARKLGQGHQIIMNNIEQTLGDVEPTLAFVQMGFNAMLGQALSQDPNFFDKIPDPSNPNPAPSTNNTTPAPRSEKPLPPRIPNGRPPVSNTNKKSTLTPSEQRLKAAMPGVAHLTDEEWKQEFYAEGQSREYDTARMNQPKKEGTK